VDVTSNFFLPFFEEQHRTQADGLEKWSRHALCHQEEPSTTKDLDHLCRDLIKKLSAEEITKAVIPKEYGGLFEKLDVRTLCLTREILAFHSGLADFVFAMQGLGSGAITLFGNQDQKSAYLPGVAAGEKIAAFALTEAEAGSDVAAISTTARNDGEDYIIDGNKTFISNGGIADFYTLFARTGEAPGAKGLTAFIIDADTQGFEIEERIECIAPHPLAKMKFTNMRVPKSAVLGQPGEGFKIAMSTLDVFRTTVGAAALGFAKRALSETLTRTKSRELFGVPLSESQVTQLHIAQMALDIEASSLLIYRAAWLKDNVERRISKEAAMAKLYATEAAQKCADTAVQLFGGLGVTKGQIPEALYREVRALRIYEGASDVQKLIIARATLANHEEKS